jgi:tetratricopeptide (TPR) repeat protein
MGYSITVSAAALLMKTLYSRLFVRDSLSLAIRHARNELYNDKKRRVYSAQLIDLEDWLLPVVYQNRPVQLTVRELTPQENTTYYEHKAQLARSAPPEPTYGFIGRDLDILRIERRLLLKRNLLLVRGMGGAGKTTLMRHLSTWWHTTGLVERVFYFGYDEHAWTRQQIIVEIAQRLLDPVAYLRDFQPLSRDAQQARLTGLLRAQRHLLILDNLESITGANLAILHTLPKKEQDDLRHLLADLAGGRTLVLLGSRSGEGWLAQGTFDDNIYDLPGLDPEAASTLADLILARHAATHYRQDEDLQHLLKLLDGFPLALEVVLSNLARQIPKEVLSALQAGAVTITVGDSEKRTENILRCIDYSHSNLSPEAQQLLLCLAPFTSVFDLGLLDSYTTHLRQQSTLAKLPFERWKEVLQEAANWGLLSPDAENPRYLRLQPTLPYFLRTRLHEPEQAEVQTAIETAFREHYREIGEVFADLLTSKDPGERQIGQFVASLEYENLVTALNLALAAQESIAGLHDVLLEYLNRTQKQSQALELFQAIQERFAAYSADKLAGPLGLEYANVLGTIANGQSDLRQYEEAVALYQKVLELADRLDRVDKENKSRLRATVYHQLGMVAQEQRQWAQARDYLLQALEIFVAYEDTY